MQIGGENYNIQPKRKLLSKITRRKAQLTKREMHDNSVRTKSKLTTMFHLDSMADDT